MLLSRQEFKTNVFLRDKTKCVVCGDIAIDAHHLIDRKCWSDGGYYLDNGVSLCSKCHIEAELCNITVEKLRELACIKTIILPDDLDGETYIYNKWGIPIEFK